MTARILLFGVACFLFISVSIQAQSDTFDLQSILQNFESLSEKTDPSSNAQEKSATIEISEIVIKGNIIIPTSLIENKIPFKQGAEIKPFMLARLEKKINALGVFIEVNVDIEKKKKENILVVNVRENPVISLIEFRGATVFNKDTLLESILSKKGEILNISIIRKDLDRIKRAYHEKGYIYATVYGVSTLEEEGDPLVFDISEGIIDELLVSGNLRTKPKLIFREMTFSAGQPLVIGDIREDLRRIYNTGYFEDVSPSFLPGDIPFSQKLVINVKEKKAGNLNGGAGYGESSGLFIFGDIYLNNAFGEGQLYSLKGQTGQTSSLQFKYHNPWMFDERRSLTYKLWQTSGEVTGLSGTSGLTFRKEARRGTSLAVGIPLSYQLNTIHTVKVEEVSLLDVPSKYGIASYRAAISYDTRDYWMNPSSGVYHVVSFEKGIPIAGAIDLNRLDLSFHQFIPTFEKQTIALRANFGRLFGTNSGSEFYFVGGSNTVRGYDSFNENEVLTGLNQVLGSAEYRFLINDFFQVVFFADLGTATNNFQDVMSPSNYIFGKGVGIRLTTPLGPLRFDYGIPSSGEGRIHFGVGHQF